LIISAVVSGAIGFYFESIRDRRLAEHGDRKEHFQRIRTEVLEKMIETLGNYRRSVDRNAYGWDFPTSLRRSEPTSSKLFETLQSHFPAVKAAWDLFEGNMELFGEETTAVYHSIEDHLLKERNLSFQHLAKLFDSDLTQHVCVNFYGLLLNPKDGKNPVDVITATPYDQKWTIDHPHGSFSVSGDDSESLDAVKQIRASLKSLASSPDLQKQAARIAQNHTMLLEDSKKLESLIRDAMARSKLEGKCKYCP
jgi:hypothetical protein